LIVGLRQTTPIASKKEKISVRKNIVLLPGGRKTITMKYRAAKLQIAIVQITNKKKSISKSQTACHA